MSTFGPPPSTSGDNILTKLSDADLLALKAGDYSKMSDQGLQALKGSSSTSTSDPNVSTADDRPDLQSGIVKARAAGYSDDEIADHLSYTVPGIKKARGAGYSNTEIIHHLAGTDDTTARSADPNVSTTEDVVKSGGIGVIKGLIGLAGLPGDGGALLNKGVNYIANPINRALGLPEAPDYGASPIGSDAIQKAVESKTGEFYKPKTTSGEYAQTVGSFLPAVIGGPESLTTKLLTRAVAPGVASEAAGQATKGTALEPYARVAAAVAGGGAAGAVAAPRQAAQALPDIDAVAAAAKAGYNSPEVQALRVHGGAVNNLGDDIAQTLERKGFFREDHPGVFSSVDRLRNAGPSVDFNRLDAIRQSLNGSAGEIDAFGRATRTAAAARSAKGQLDDFIHTNMTNPNNVLTGNPVAARAALQEARDNAGAGIRAEQVQRQIGNAENAASVANSGMNIQNRIRNKLKTFIDNDGAKMGGYTPAEQAQMQRLVRGSMLMNSLRHVGNALGGGGGVHAIPEAFIGHALFGPVGTAIPAAGWAMKTAANIATQRMANNIANTLLARAPLVQRTLAANRAIRSTNATATRSGAANAALRALLVNRLLSNDR